VAAQKDERELDERNQKQQTRGRHEATQVVVRDRAVDDVLDHLRDGRRGDEASDLGESEHHHEPGIRPQVGDVAAQGEETQRVA
jgi:hypothetical protein